MEAIVRFASSSELLFFIILPVVFTFLPTGGTPNGEQDNRIRLLVVDESRTAVSQQIIDELESSTAVYPEVVARDEAQSQFDERRTSSVLIIPTGIDLASLQTVLLNWKCSSNPTTSTQPSPSVLFLQPSDG